MFVTGNRLITFTVSYGAYLPNAIDRGIAFQKIKQLLRFGTFYLLRVSTSKRSPKRMQLSLIVTSAEREVKVSRRSGMYQSYNFLTGLGMQSL